MGAITKRQGRRTIINHIQNNELKAVKEFVSSADYPYIYHEIATGCDKTHGDQMLRNRLSQETKDAMRAKDSARLSTLRLINAAIKDRDIAARSEDNTTGVSDDDILKILAKMIKQRRDSAEAYDEGGRIELAERERAEIEVIQSFLPKQLSETDVRKAIADAIQETGANSIRDMGRIMSVLKDRYAGQMDFGKAGAEVKATLG